MDFCWNIGTYREQAEAEATEQRDVLNSTKGPILRAWSDEPGTGNSVACAGCLQKQHVICGILGQKKNIRTLLSSMHTVLWEGARFTPISMSNLLQPSDIKKSYRKAIMLVHPDKSSGRSHEQKFLADRVFEALNKSWEEFEAKEMR